VKFVPVGKNKLQNRKLRLKVRTFTYRRLQGNQNSSGLQCEVAYWPELAVGSAAQLAAAHCPLEALHGTIFPVTCGVLAVTRSWLARDQGVATCA